MSRVPTNGIDYTSKDYESFRNDMIKQLGIKMPEYTDKRQSDAGIVLLELLAQGLDVISFYQDVIANEVFLVTAEQRDNALKWCQMFGYTPKYATPSEFLQVFVLSSPQETDTIIPAGTQVKTQGTDSEPSIYFETKKDLIIPAGFLGDEMQDGEYRFATEVVQGITILSEFLGSSTGSADQSFTLNYTPAIFDSITVVVDEGTGFTKWERVNNFVDSGFASRHYMVTVNDRDEATIVFGDGVSGKIPKVYANGIYCSYRVGGGTEGNVAPAKINVMDSNIALIDHTFNVGTPIVEGKDKETLDEIKINAPAFVRTIWGALTTRDFAGVIKYYFGEVDKAVSYAVGERNKDVDIYVLLKNDSPLTESLKKEMEDTFDENLGGRKLIGAGTIRVLSAIKRPVNITATMEVNARYDFEEVKSKVVALLEDYFAVGNYDFNTELSLSALCSEVVNPDNAIEGIRYFKITSPTGEIVTPSNGELLTLGTLTITNGGA